MADSPVEIAAVSNHALTAVASKLMGPAGHIMIALAAVLACSSAINATLLGACCCGAAIILLCLEVYENPATKSQLWIVSGTILLSFVLELVYRRWRR